MEKERNLYTNAWEDLLRDKSMILLAGPRQSGKTTLAKQIARTFTNSMYFSWDIPTDRLKLLENRRFYESVERRDTSKPLIIFDEIHKFRDWKNYLKGVYDEGRNDYSFLVSGSGRLDIYQKGGDSLAGRYLMLHLWPFTMAELAGGGAPFDQFMRNPLFISMERNSEQREIWEQLSRMSGFPEPFLANRATSYRRWSQGYSRQLIREDIRELTELKLLQEMENLYLLLPSKIGSPLSVASLSGSLRVAYNSIRSWLDVLERFFLVFSISPWTGRIARAIQKERKYYLWDVPRIQDTAARFENMAAIELYRAVTSWNDLGLGRFSLHFIRNKEKEEVDFLIAGEKGPVLLVEAKLSEKDPSSSLRKFQRMLRVPAVQIVGEGETYRLLPNDGMSILIAPAWAWFSMLP